MLKSKTRIFFLGSLLAVGAAVVVVFLLFSDGDSSTDPDSSVSNGGAGTSGDATSTPDPRPDIILQVTPGAVLLGQDESSATVSVNAFDSGGNAIPTGELEIEWMPGGNLSRCKNRNGIFTGSSDRCNQHPSSLSWIRRNAS